MSDRYPNILDSLLFFQLLIKQVCNARKSVWWLRLYLRYPGVNASSITFLCSFGFKAHTSQPTKETSHGQKRRESFSDFSIFLLRVQYVWGPRYARFGELLGDIRGVSSPAVWRQVKISRPLSLMSDRYPNILDSLLFFQLLIKQVCNARKSVWWLRLYILDLFWGVWEIGHH